MCVSNSTNQLENPMFRMSVKKIEQIIFRAY
jgi:hypothetical protein